MEPLDRPLVQKLIHFKNQKHDSFHVPGHKNGLLSNLPEDLRTALAYDLTELKGLDDLHEPEGVIQSAQDKLSKLYNSNRSFFLVNGSTVGNLAMVYSTCRKDDIIIVQRNAHKSIFNAIELTGAKAVFIHPKWDDQSMTAGMITASQIKSAITLYPDAKAVLLTYPTYYGVAGDELEEIIRLCHEQKIPVLVDEAHGAHFVIGEPFPRSALSMGADVVVHSAHKTLPAMTMASYLHVHSELVAVETVSRYLEMLQSSSPSYLLLASLDDARSYVETFGEEDSHYLLAVRKEFIKELTYHSSIEVILTDDPLKLILRIKGVSGFIIQEMLNEIGVYVELADPYQVLFVLPLLKKEFSYPFKEIVRRIHGIINERQFTYERAHEKPTQLVEDISQAEYTVGELEEFKCDWLFYEHSLGKVSAATVTPYPPGIPLLLKGERITETHIEILNKLFTLKAHLQGTIKLEEKELFVVIDETEE